MRKRPDESPGNELPACAVEFIRRVTRKTRYRRKVRREVQAELTAHFEDALRDCATGEERGHKAQALIEEFGDAGLLAVLCRRAKKRCRPLWLRTVLRTLQVVGVFLLVFIPYTIWFVRGKPNPTIDYLPQLNALHRSSGPVDDDAWPYYERAMRLVVEPNETLKRAVWLKSVKPVEEPLTPQDRKALEDWIAANATAWSQLEFGAALGHCHRVYHPVPGVPLWYSWDDPPMARLRRLAQLGLRKSRLAAEQGRVDEALDSCLTLLRMGAHWQTNALLMDQLLGQHMAGETCQEILRILTATDLLPSQLSDLQTRLLQVYQRGYPLTNFDGERLIVLDIVQHDFTDGGPGGGHRVTARYVADLKTAIDSSGPEASAIADVIAPPVGVGLSMIHASRNRTITKIDQVSKRLREIAKLSPYERRVANIDDLGEKVGAMEKWRYALVYTLLPAERRASEVRFQAKADYEALVTVLAIKRYWLDTGDYPPDLKTLLQAGYLKKLPMDPFSDRPLVYKPAGESFSLYSVGRDFNDDGGEPGRDKDGRPKMWADNGDTVFWPVP